MNYNHSKLDQLTVFLRELAGSQDDDSPLEILFSHYSEFCAPWAQDDLQIQRELREVLLQAAPEQADQLIDLIHLICFHYERVSFFNGLRAGVRLAGELVQ